MSDPGRTPIGLKRLVRDVHIPPTERLLGVSLFFSRHAIGASLANSAGMASTAAHEAAAMIAEAASTHLPLVVALAVTDCGVRVIEAQPDGRHLGAEVAYWPNRTFRVLVVGWPLVRLSLSTEGGPLHLECKTFPVGPNRHNRRVVRLVQQAAGIPASHRR